MIFVTGGTGFVGGNLLSELVKQGNPVKALIRKQSSKEYVKSFFDYKFGKESNDLFAKILWVEGNILDSDSIQDAMMDVDEVYHCAAEVTLSDAKAEITIDTSEKGTATMVDAALSNGIKKLCFVSSTSALGPLKNGELITEECFDNFAGKNSPYETGKHLAELQVWRGNAEGLNVVVVNPSIILGPWYQISKGSMSFFPLVEKFSAFYTEGIMGFTYINDLIYCMLRLMNENYFNNRYIISSENLSLYELFSSIAFSLGKRAPVIRQNRFSLKVFKMAYNITHSNKITSLMIEHALGKIKYNNEKITRTLQFTFKPMKDVIAETAQFYLHECEKY